MTTRLVSALPWLLVGLIVGAVLMQFAMPPISGTSVPSHSLATATGCADDGDPRAWLGYVPHNDYRAVYLTNYSFVHDDPDITVRAELNEAAEGDWTLAIMTSPDDSEKQVPDDCRPRTVLDASIAIPTSAERVTVTLDGEQVASMRTVGSSPRFRYLEE